MSAQRIFAETGREKISSKVRWCLRFIGLWYQKTVLNVVLLLVWRGWDLHEQRRFLAREAPGVWTVFGLTLLAVLSVLAPLLFAGWTRWGGRPLSWFYIGLLISFFFAILYVFQYHSPQKMQLPTSEGQTPP